MSYFDCTEADANLRYANLSSADLSGANLSYAKNLTPEQVKSAENWDKAKYDKDFRAKLGLPPEPAK
ncbi:pentapeptide repeat-containing protein [Nostoc sp. JL31]|uniref:pentapeptide repeat-containing protein n=1 Tax=Nostoc sp. JL31 TaxID=2815395 RepID=UPI0025DD639B|nr:pentapeptide repeat-containing protein [Nostoc sp. JL31]